MSVGVNRSLPIGAKHELSTDGLNSAPAPSSSAGTFGRLQVRHDHVRDDDGQEDHGEREADDEGEQGKNKSHGMHNPRGRAIQSIYILYQFSCAPPKGHVLHFQGPFK